MKSNVIILTVVLSLVLAFLPIVISGDTPNYTLNAPANDEVNVSTNAFLNISATDTDGDNMNISIYDNDSYANYEWFNISTNSSYIDNWTNPTYINDGNWSSCGEVNAEAGHIVVTLEGTYYENYTYSYNGTTTYKVKGKVGYPWQKIRVYVKNSTDSWEELLPRFPPFTGIVTKTYDVYGYPSSPLQIKIWVENKEDGTSNKDASLLCETALQYKTYTLQTTENITDGTDITYNWTGLDYGTTYNWYAVITDGTNTTTTSVFNFTTESNTVPNYTLNSPADGAIDQPKNTTLNITVTDADNDTMNASFYYKNFNNYTLYQETANSTSTIASYTCDSNCSHVYDGNWNTGVTLTGALEVNSSVWNMNYTKPSFSINATLQMKYRNDTDEYTENLTIPDSCFDYSSDRILVRLNAYKNSYYGTDATYILQCYSSRWETLKTWIKTFSNANSAFYEEGLYWYLQNNTLISSDTNILNGSIANVTTSTLVSYQTYEWFAVITDKADSTTTLTYNFTAGEVNTIPTTPDAGLNTSIKVGELLSITCENSTDADSDSLTNYSEVYNINDSLILKNYSTVMNYTIVLSDAHDKLRVRCKSSDGTANSSEGEANITVSDTIPTNPTSLSLNQTIYVTQNLTGICGGSTDADNDAITYHYYFYDENDSVLQNFSSIDYYTLTSSEAHDLINVTCKATTSDANSTGTYSNTTQVDNSVPTAPSLLIPTDGQQVYTSVDFKWTASIDADGDNLTYYLVYGSLSNPTEILYSGVSTQYLSYSPSSSGTYYWRVRASDGTVNSSWSSEYSFKFGSGGTSGGGSSGTHSAVSVPAPEEEAPELYTQLYAFGTLLSPEYANPLQLGFIALVIVGLTTYVFYEDEKKAREKRKKKKPHDK